MQSGFWFRWMLACAAGVGLASMGTVLASPIMGFLYGGLIGAAQALVLRHCWGRVRWWVLASALGWVVGLFAVGPLVLLYFGTNRWSDDLVIPAAAFISGVEGTAIAVAQWLVLRGRVRHATWWLPCHCVAFSLLGPVVFFVTASAFIGLSEPAYWALTSAFGPNGWIESNREAIPASLAPLAPAVVLSLSAAVGGASGGAAYGALTGGVLAWMLRESRTARSTQVRVSPKSASSVRWLLAVALVIAACLAIVGLWRSRRRSG